MRFDSEALGLHLKHRQLLRLPADNGARVTCRSGCVWITRDGDANDIVLEPGQTFQSERGDGIIIYGLHDADIDVVEIATAPARVAAPRRLPAAWLGWFGAPLAAAAALG